APGPEFGGQPAPAVLIVIVGIRAADDAIGVAMGTEILAEPPDVLPVRDVADDRRTEGLADQRQEDVEDDAVAHAAGPWVPEAASPPRLAVQGPHSDLRGSSCPTG